MTPDPEPDARQAATVDRDRPAAGQHAPQVHTTLLQTMCHEGQRTSPRPILEAFYKTLTR